jgi:hypothetical protein
MLFRLLVDFILNCLEWSETVTGTQKKLAFEFGLGSKNSQDPKKQDPDSKYQIFWV